METIFDLPAHPLMVHFPVVAIPVLAILGLVMVARPAFRDRYAMPILLGAIVTTVATFMAARSGEALADSIGIGDEFIDPHRDLGNMLRFFVLGLAASVGATVAVNKRSAATGRDPLAMAAAVAVVVFSLLSLVWTVRTGHEGAKSVWEGVIATDDTGEDADSAVETSADTIAPAADTPTSEAPSTEAPAETTTQAPTTEAEAATTSESTDEPETSTAGTEALGPADGQAVYEANCTRCHGADGGGGRGPSLQGIAIDQPDPADAIQQTIDGGGGMPAFGALLDEAEIIAAIDYIYATF